MGRARLTLQRDFTATAMLRRAIDRIGREQGLSPADRFDLQLAVTEAVANALEHGPDEDVEVAMSTGDGFVDVEVWSRTRFQRDRPGQAPVEAERGRGIPLMRALVDELSFDVTPDGTSVKLRKNVRRPG
jgi:serine/threonine-protein kinase RsbW